MAAHKPTKWRGIDINAGEILTGRNQLSRQTGLSERQVRTALNHLKSTNEVTIKSTNEFSIISIVKWDTYQTSDQPEASERPTSDQRPTTYKNVKNDNNEKEVKVGVAKAPQRGERLSVFMERSYPTEASLCPDLWGEEAQAIAMKYDPSSNRDWTQLILYQWDKFYDWATSVSGAKGNKLDWRKAWLNWWRGEVEKYAAADQRTREMNERFRK